MPQNAFRAQHAGHDLPQHEPNVTPMLDVLLVLLVTFMVAVVGVHQTMDVQLAAPCGELCGRGSPPIVLEILPGERFLLNRTEIPARELLPRLRAVYIARPEKVIQIAGHPGVRYEEVIAAMDVARSAGVRVIGVPLRDSYLVR
jgi:biopolymer transport protein ExbD